MGYSISKSYFLMFVMRCQKIVMLYDDSFFFSANHAKGHVFLIILKYFILTNHGKKSNLYMG